MSVMLMRPCLAGVHYGEPDSTNSSFLQGYASADANVAMGDGSVRFLHDPVVVPTGGALPINIGIADLDYKPPLAFTDFDIA